MYGRRSGGGWGEGPHQPLPRSEGCRRRARTGAVIGAVFTAVVLWSILVASAATLGQGNQAVTSAQDAAQALRPVAGSAAADFFAFGLVVSTVVALPVLMVTTAYVVGAQFDWRRGLSEPVRGPRFLWRPSGLDRAFLRRHPGPSVGDRHARRRQRDRRVRDTYAPGAVLVLLARDPVVMGAQPISRRPRRRRMDGRRGCGLLRPAVRCRGCPGEGLTRSTHRCSRALGLGGAQSPDCAIGLIWWTATRCPCGPTATTRRGRWRRVDGPG